LDLSRKPTLLDLLSNLLVASHLRWDPAAILVPPVSFALSKFLALCLSLKVTRHR